MFRFFKLPYVQSKAEFIIRDQLILQYNQGFFNGDPYTSAHNLIKNSFNDDPVKYDGSIEKIPEELVCAICALEFAIKDIDYLKLDYINEFPRYLAYTVIMGNLINDINLYKSSIKDLSMYDRYLIDLANSTLIKKMEELNNVLNNDENMKQLDKLTSYYDNHLEPGEQEFIDGLPYYKNKNFEVALDYFRRSAEKGYPKGMYNYAIMFIKEDGEAKNYKEAMIWYEKAAKKGHILSQLQIGLCNLFVTENFEEAYAWLYLASQRGNMDALEAFTVARSKIIIYKDRLKIAEEKAKEYLKKYTI